MASGSNALPSTHSLVAHEGGGVVARLKALLGRCAGLAATAKQNASLLVLRRQANASPHDTGVVARLAAAYESAGRRDAAVATYQRIAAIHRGRADAYGLVFAARKLEQLGVRDLAHVYRDLARIHGDARRFGDAASACRRVLELYVAEGQLMAARGYFAHLPPLGAAEDRELRAWFERVLEGLEGASTPVRPTGRLEPAPGDSAFLQGTLGRITVFDVVQIVETNALTGRVVVENPRPLAPSTLHFDEGRIVAAEYGALRGAAAARQIVQLQTGAFRVETGEQPHADELGIESNTAFLLDLVREIDEASADEPPSIVTSAIVELE